jgi:hypothetical protein
MNPVHRTDSARPSKLDVGGGNGFRLRRYRAAWDLANAKREGFANTTATGRMVRSPRSARELLARKRPADCVTSAADEWAWEPTDDEARDAIERWSARAG